MSEPDFFDFQTKHKYLTLIKNVRTCQLSKKKYQKTYLNHLDIVK